MTRITYILALLLCMMMPVLQLQAQTAAFSEDSVIVVRSYTDENGHTDTLSEVEYTGEDYESDGPATEAAYDESFSFSFPDSADAVTQMSRPGMNTADWNTETQKPEFQYEQKKETPPQEDTGDSWLVKLISAIFDFFASSFGKFLLWAIVAAFVLLIVWLLIRNNGISLFARKDRKLQTAAADETADDYMPDRWEDVIQKAEASGDYRLAIRHSYRHILILLHERGTINYQPAASNYQYAHVLSGNKDQELYQLFKKLLYHYEFAWYGGFSVSDAHYNTIRNIYQQLKQKIS